MIFVLALLFQGVDQLYCFLCLIPKLNLHTAIEEFGLIIIFRCCVKIKHIS